MLSASSGSDTPEKPSNMLNFNMYSLRNRYSSSYELARCFMKGVGRFRKKFFLVELAISRPPAGVLDMPSSTPFFVLMEAAQPSPLTQKKIYDYDEGARKAPSS